MACSIPSCACAGCGAPTSVTTMTPASVTAMSRLWFWTVTMNQVNAAKNVTYKRTCVSFNLPKHSRPCVFSVSFLHCRHNARDPIHLARHLFQKRRNIRQALRKLSGQLLVALQQRLSFVLLQEPSAILPLPRECRAYPVRQWGRHDSNRLGCLGFFPNHQQHLGAAAFSRCAEPLHLVHRYRIQAEVIDHRGHISGLLPDDLRAGVLQDSRPVDPRLKLRAHEVFDGLADAPHA